MSNCIDKYTHCPFMPDMTVGENDIKIDCDGVKHRKNKKTFKCLYDNHILNWDEICPREDIKDEGCQDD